MQSVTPRRVIGLERIPLYDFITGRPDLLDRHREGLERYVLPWLGERSQPMSVWIGGLASRRGDESFNRRLARARASMVAGFVFSRTPAAGLRHAVTAESFGETLSRDHTENSEFYRSVLVLVNRPPPLRAPPPRPAPSLSRARYNRFRIYSSALQGRFDIDNRH